MRFIKRILNVIEGLVFLVVSLGFQSIFVLLLTMAFLAGLQSIGLDASSRTTGWIVFGLLLLCFNSIACWEYFKKRRAQVGLGRTSSAIFMFPRALDLIWNGSERISR